VQIAEEAGATVTRMDGEDFTVFDRSVIASNGKLHSQVGLLQTRRSSIVPVLFQGPTGDRPIVYATKVFALSDREKLSEGALTIECLISSALYLLGVHQHLWASFK
jgi:hypothetical protein